MSSALISSPLQLPEDQNPLTIAFAPKFELPDYRAWLPVSRETDGVQTIPAAGPSHNSAAKEADKNWVYFGAPRLTEASFTPWDADHRPNPREDIGNYIARFSKSYREIVERLSNQMCPMHPECEATVNIPVAAHDEVAYIYRTLKSFTAQTVSPNSFQIALFLNFPSDRASNPTVRDTFSEVARFKRDFPHIQVGAMCASLEGPTRIQRAYGNLPVDDTIALRRSLVTDPIVYLNHLRNPDDDHILIRSDADTRGVANTFIEHFIARFAARPNTDSFIGQLLWSMEDLARDPLLFVNQILHSTVCRGASIYNSHHRSGDPRERHYSSGGPASAVKASMYCYLGGYNDRVPYAEDCDFADRLSDLRGRSRDYIAQEYAGSSARLETSARRAYAALAYSTPSIAQWDLEETSFKGVDDIRRNAWENIVSSKQRPILVEQIQDIIDASMKGFKRYYPHFSADFPPLHKALSLYLGFEFVVTGPQSVEITNADKFFERWEQLREAYAGAGD